MSVTPEYREFVLEQLGRIAPVTARSMFGGVGIYSNGLFFALMDDDRVYLKVDDSNREDFIRAGTGIFAPYGDHGKTMQYYELPAELLETENELRAWVERAIAVAHAARRRKGR